MCIRDRDLSELIQGCLLPFEPVAFEAGVQLEARVDPGLTPVSYTHLDVYK